MKIIENENINNALLSNENQVIDVKNIIDNSYPNLSINSKQSIAYTWLDFMTSHNGNKATNQGLLKNIESYLINKKATLKSGSFQYKKYALKKMASLNVKNKDELAYINHIFKDNRFKTIKKQSHAIDNSKIVKKHEMINALKILKLESNFKNYMIVKFLYLTGLRVSELINIKHNDITINDDMVNIKIIGKGLKLRIIEITLSLYNEIKTIFNHDNEYLFYNKNQNTFSRDDIYKRIKTCFKKLGLNVSPHMLRHTNATELVNSNHDIHDISNRLGHASIDTTSKFYIHSKLDSKKSINDLMSLA